MLDWSQHKLIQFSRFTGSRSFIHLKLVWWNINNTSTLNPQLDSRKKFRYSICGTPDFKRVNSERVTQLKHLLTLHIPIFGCTFQQLMSCQSRRFNSWWLRWNSLSVQFNHSHLWNNINIFEKVYLMYLKSW